MMWLLCQGPHSHYISTQLNSYWKFVLDSAFHPGPDLTCQRAQGKRDPLAPVLIKSPQTSCHTVNKGFLKVWRPVGNSAWCSSLQQLPQSRTIYGKKHRRCSSEFFTRYFSFSRPSVHPEEFEHAAFRYGSQDISISFKALPSCRWLDMTCSIIQCLYASTRHHQCKVPLCCSASGETGLSSHYKLSSTKL